WTDHTFNIAWGCQEVSPGCQHCYARTWATRRGYGDTWGGPSTPRRRLSAAYWRRPLAWNAAALRDGHTHHVFTGSMADAFEDHPIITEERARLWDLIAQTPALTWQVLTKRPENVLGMIPPAWLEQWPAHVWLMTSTETHRQASLRIPWL